MLQIHRDIVELKTKLEAACKQIEAQNAIADDLKSHRTSVKTIAAIAGAVITGGIALCALLVGPEISILRDHAHKLQAEKSQQDAKLPAANSSSKSD